MTHFLVSFLFNFLVTVSSFNLPTYLPRFGDSINHSSGCLDDSTVIDTSITRVNLYSAVRYGNGTFLFQRSHIVTNSQRDTFNLYDASPGYSYAYEVEDRVGNKSCWKYQTVGIPTVSIEEYIRLIKKEKIYDINSRVIKYPSLSGIYFTKRYGKFVVLDGRIVSLVNKTP